MKRRKKSFLTRAGKVLRDHLFPHKGNNHTPHVIRHRALFGYSVLIIALKVLVITASIALPAASLFSSAITANNIISLTNETRKSLGLSTLSENSKLDESATLKAEDMLTNQYFAHTSPSGVTPWSWFGKTGYTYTYAGENLAVYFTSSEDTMAGWLASPTHRANIVDTRYTEIGVGVAQGTYNNFPAIFVVQHFGYPKSSNTIAENTGTTSAEKTEPVTENNQQSVLAATTTNEPVTTVTPTENAYNITVTDPDATEVTAHLGTESAALTKTDDTTWEGTVPYDAHSLSNSGEQLYVVSAGSEGDTVEPVALAAPETSTQSLYAFNSGSGNEKLFGFVSVGDLNDHVKQFYIITIIFIAGILLMTLLAKFKWDRVPLVAHSLAVIAIAILLTII